MLFFSKRGNSETSRYGPIIIFMTVLEVCEPKSVIRPSSDNARGMPGGSIGHPAKHPGLQRESMRGSSSQLPGRGAVAARCLTNEVATTGQIAGAKDGRARPY